MFLVALFIERYPRFGRYILAIGGAEDRAKLAGIPIDKYKIMAFTLAGLFIGVAGVLNSARIGAGTSTAGPNQPFAAITAVVVGGTAPGEPEGGENPGRRADRHRHQQWHGPGRRAQLRAASSARCDHHRRSDPDPGSKQATLREIRLADMANEIVLEVRNVTKSFPGVTALDQVSLQVRRHEIIGLVGENGAGKSTLLKILIGAYQPDEGEAIGARQASPSQECKRSHRCRPSHGFPGAVLLPNLTVRENIFLGHEEPFIRFAGHRLEENGSGSQAPAGQAGPGYRPGTYTSSLSFAARQMVELARLGHGRAHTP